jgi:3-deoxy-D-manno-octulosonic-acid transferase
MFFLYRIFINVILIFSPLIILVRLLKKKEDTTRYKEKFSFFSKKKYKGKLIWFHGASVGEILSVVPLIQKLEKNKKISQILVTSNTLSSSKILNNLNLKKTVHQFFPIDHSYFVNKFLNYWSPSLAIFIDSEVWPTMFCSIKNKSISLILLNARINKKSFKKWAKLGLTAKALFNKFDLCLSSSNESKKHLRLLGAKNIKYIGNLKFTESAINKKNLNKNLKKFFLSKKIWCASSTHNKEELICANVHKKLKMKHKNLLTILIPRHVDRTIEIMNQVKKLNLKIHLHDPVKKVDKDVDIYLVNSFGQTESFFKICKTVFLGGSIIKHGGQNPLEAVRLGCKVLHGPHVWNFDEIYKLLKKHKVSNKVTTSNKLTYEVNKMLNNKSNNRSLELKIKNLGNKILISTLNEINIYINR